MKPIILILAIMFLSGAASSQEMTARQSIETFYKSYLGVAGVKGNSKLAFGYSSSFKKLLQENRRLCKSYDGICGWGAEEDTYLNAQEIEPGLSYESSGFKALESELGRVTVSFNVYPSIDDGEKYYFRKFTYKLVKEGGIWVIDDIVYAYPTKTSARRTIRNENESIVADIREKSRNGRK